MGNGLRKIGPNRFREEAGGYYEDFNVGDIFEHRPGRTISEADNTWFTLLTMNQHPVHFDKAYAGKTEFGRLLVNSAFTMAVVVGMSVSSTSQKAVANLGWKEVNFTAPVYVGDTIYAETRITEKRESKSRPENGIVTVETTGLKEDGTIFMTSTRSFLVPKKGHGTDDTAGY